MSNIVNYDHKNSVSEEVVFSELTNHRYVHINKPIRYNFPDSGNINIIVPKHTLVHVPDIVNRFCSLDSKYLPILIIYQWLNEYRFVNYNKVETPINQKSIDLFIYKVTCDITGSKILSMILFCFMWLHSRFLLDVTPEEQVIRGVYEKQLKTEFDNLNDNQRYTHNLLHSHPQVV